MSSITVKDQAGLDKADLGAELGLAIGTAQPGLLDTIPGGLLVLVAGVIFVVIALAIMAGSARDTLAGVPAVLDPEARS